MKPDLEKIIPSRLEDDQLVNGVLDKNTGGDLINSERTSLETWLIDEQVTTPPPPDQAIVIHRLCDLTVVICQQVLQGCLLRRLAFVLPSWKNSE